jgi:hypothetical protein
LENVKEHRVAHRSVPPAVKRREYRHLRGIPGDGAPPASRQLREEAFEALDQLAVKP